MARKSGTKSIWRIGGKILLALTAFMALLVLGLIVIFAVINRTNGSILSSEEKRSYLLYVPESYNPNTPTPLVISLHGFAEWPAHQAKISHWNEVADEYGFIVVYPSGTDFPKRWRISGFSADPANLNVDSQFISDLIDALENEYNIDSTRIYANGLSNGGGMSIMLACTMADRIAAVGSVAGAYMSSMDQCEPLRPVPLIAFHGTADPIVPFEGGPSRSFDLPFPVVTDWIKAWAERNQCSPEAEALPAGREINGIQYTQCLENADVVFYTIAGGGHAWPGGDPIPAWIVGYTSQEIDTTRVMWEFFQQHPLK